jgi:uncharacterized protein
MDPVLVGLGIAGILLGLAGVLIPVVPGSFVVWLATAGTLLLHRADAIAWVLALLLGLLAVSGSLATIVLPARAGLASGAARRSFLLGAAGALLGFFLLPVLGAVIGFLAGLLVGERLRRGALAPARAAIGRVITSYGVGVAVDLAAALLMALIWVIAVVARS